MVLVIGFVLTAVYVAYLMLASPPHWASAVGGLVVVVLFAGLFVYFTERENQPRRTAVDENERSSASS